MGNSSGGVVRADVTTAIAGTPFAQCCGSGFAGSRPERPGGDRLRDERTPKARAQKHDSASSEKAFHGIT